MRTKMKMNKTLTNIEWKVFHLNDIFTNYHGKRLVKEHRKAGNIPLLTASESTQGVSAYISKTKGMVLHSDFISIDMFGHAFYHDYNCYGDDNIYFFENDTISKNAKLFIVACINKNSSKYSYGNQFRQDNADKDKIILPVNSKGKPDYKFMEEYVKEHADLLKKQYVTHVKALIANLHKSINKNRDWRDFSISEIFEIKPGKRLTKANMKAGNIPFIGASDSNNGITNFISNENISTDKHVLGVNYNGSVVENFYHPYKCTFSDDVKRFSTKETKGNKYIYLFVKNAILKQKNKYMWGYKFNETRMAKQRIMLPVNSKGDPDYKYMEDYMRYLEQQKILSYLDYLA